jgi:hypothetical protein
MSKESILLKMKENEALYIIFSTATKCPYVYCDPETFDDEIFVFFTEEEAREKWEELRADQTPVNIVRLENKHFLFFYTSLFTMGINALVVSEGTEKVVFQLEEIVHRAQPGERKDGTVWVENPQLHLTSLYMMQDVRKNNGKMKPEHQAMLEEVVAHFAKGKMIQPLRKEGRSIPLLKLPDGDKYQPVFTDILEFQKFNRENQFSPLVVEAVKMPRVLVKEAVGIVINPLGVNVPLKMERKQSQEAPAHQMQEAAAAQMAEHTETPAAQEEAPATEEE